MNSDPLERMGEIVRSERAELLGVARRQGATPEEALECVQDALCTYLLQERQGVLPEAPADIGALYTMVKNEARNLRRRHHRLKPHRPIEGEDVHLLSTTASAEELLVCAEDTVRLRACVSSLCGVQRAVVTLRLLEERSGDDVADALGVSRNHVDVLVHRAKASLRMCMREPDPGS